MAWNLKEPFDKLSVFSKRTPFVCFEDNLTDLRVKSIIRIPVLCQLQSDIEATVGVEDKILVVKVVQF